MDGISVAAPLVFFHEKVNQLAGELFFTVMGVMWSTQKRNLVNALMYGLIRALFWDHLRQGCACDGYVFEQGTLFFVTTAVTYDV